MITCYPFSGQPVTDSQYGLLLGLLGDGVLGAPGDTSLQAFADSTGLHVKVRAGSGVLAGRMFSSDAVETISLSALPSSAQTFLVTFYVNIATGASGFEARAGVESVRRESSGVWEVALAKVTVGAGAATVAPSAVADAREFAPAPFGVWSTSTRPVSGLTGSTVGLNTSTGKLERWNGSSWAAVQVPADSIAGALSASQVPPLDAGKVASGVLGVERLPSIPVAKLSGSVNAQTIDGRKVFVQSGTPSGASNGDIWIQVV